MTFDGGSTSDSTYTENGLTISAVDTGDTLNFEVGTNPTDRDLQLKSGPNNPYRIENLTGTLTLVSVDVIAKVGGSAGKWTAFKDLNNDGDYDDAGEQFSVSTDNVTGTFFFGDQFKNVDYVTFETVNDNPNANQSQTIDNLTFLLENQPILSSAIVAEGEEPLAIAEANAVASEDTSVDELAESGSIVQLAAASSTEPTPDSVSTLDGAVLVAATEETNSSEPAGVLSDQNTEGVVEESDFALSPVQSDPVAASTDANELWSSLLRTPARMNRPRAVALCNLPLPPQPNQLRTLCPPLMARS